jgi:hypothetical protein
VIFATTTRLYYTKLHYTIPLTLSGCTQTPSLRLGSTTPSSQTRQTSQKPKQPPIHSPTHPQWPASATQPSGNASPSPSTWTKKTSSRNNNTSRNTATHRKMKRESHSLQNTPHPSHLHLTLPLPRLRPSRYRSYSSLTLAQRFLALAPTIQEKVPHASMLVFLDYLPGFCGWGCGSDYLVGGEWGSGGGQEGDGW